MQQHHHFAHLVLSATYFALYTVLAVEGQLADAACALVAGWAYLLLTPGGPGKK